MMMITNEEILLWANSRKLSYIVTERRFRMTGHNTTLTRSSSGESGNILDSSSKTGRPQKTWRRTFQQYLQMVDFKWEEVEYVALTVQNGAKLLPDVPKGTRGTKSKSRFIS